MQSSLYELNLHRYLEGLQVLHAETFDGPARFCFIVCPAQLHVGTDDLCTHSGPDAEVLFEDRRLLFSVVVCNDGWMEVLWQDGRRMWKKWGS